MNARWILCGPGYLTFRKPLLERDDRDEESSAGAPGERVCSRAPSGCDTNPDGPESGARLSARTHDSHRALLLGLSFRPGRARRLEAREPRIHVALPVHRGKGRSAGTAPSA